MSTAPNADTTTPPPPSSGHDSAHERAYGTFEVSVIEVDSDSEQVPKQPSTRRLAIDDDQDESAAHFHSCTGDDCCVVVNVLWAPLRLETYTIVLFHVLNFALAVAAGLWTFWFHVLKFILSSSSSGVAARIRRMEATSLRTLLEWDSALFNLISPPAERVIVFSSSTSFRDEHGVYGFYAQLYFGIAKLLCSAVPGLLSAAFYVWSLVHCYHVAVNGDADDATAPEARDIALLLAVAGIYATVALTKLVAHLARHITVFFCAEYLLYSAM